MKKPSPTRVIAGSGLKPARTGFAKTCDRSCGIGSGFFRDGVSTGGFYCT
jgi:hypothetical protein